MAFPAGKFRFEQITTDKCIDLISTKLNSYHLNALFVKTPGKFGTTVQMHSGMM